MRHGLTEGALIYEQKAVLCVYALTFQRPKGVIFTSFSPLLGRNHYIYIRDQTLIKFNIPPMPASMVCSTHAYCTVANLSIVTAGVLSYSYCEITNNWTNLKS